MRIAHTALLRCPATGLPLRWEGTNLELMLADGALQADGGPAWPVVDGLPLLCRDEDLGAVDQRVRHIHDRLPRAHRPLLRVALPLLQGGGGEGGLHRAAREALDLGGLGPGDRLLELGVGEGTNLGWLRAATQAELWGVDTSEVLLRRCRARWAAHPFHEKALLLQADAHRLPFPDQSFHRIFHLGGLGRFQDPARVVAEALRVCKPGGRVALIGKRLDPSEPAAPPFQAAFKLLTLWEPEVPLASLRLPAGVSAEEHQVSRFFSCMVFRPGGPNRG